MTLEHDVKLPTDSSIYVHNLSAVGRAVPRLPARATRSRRTPRTARSSRATSRRCRSTRRDLLVDIDDFVGSVDQREPPGGGRGAGPDVRRHRPRAAGPARQRLDVRRRGLGPHRRDDRAAAQRADRAAHPAAGRRENIRSFARDLSHAHRGPARQRRGPAQGAEEHPGRRPRAASAARRTSSRRCRCCSATWSPSTRSCSRYLAGLEQLLVTYPALMAGGPTGSTRDGWGHINLQFDYSVPPCTEGYLPPSEWRSPARPDGRAVLPGQVRVRAPYEMRGPKYAPGPPRERVPAARLQWRLRSGDRAGSGRRRRRRAARWSSVSRGTCRSLEGMRGSGCWWVRWRAGDPGLTCQRTFPRPAQHRAVRRRAALRGRDRSARVADLGRGGDPTGSGTTSETW